VTGGNDPSSELDNWANATLNRSGTFDYSFRYALSDLANSNGFYNVGNLPSLQQQNRFKTVPFLNNHDNQDDHVGTYVDPDHPRTQLAYAVAMTVDGSPQLFILDLFQTIFNATAAAHITRPWMVNLLWCHQKLAFESGEYFVRYQGSQQLLILERGARAIVAINNDGSNFAHTFDRQFPRHGGRAPRPYCPALKSWRPSRSPLPQSRLPRPGSADCFLKPEDERYRCWTQRIELEGQTK
jgi:hypothetical protein